MKFGLKEIEHGVMNWPHVTQITDKPRALKYTEIKRSGFVKVI